MSDSKAVTSSPRTPKLPPQALEAEQSVLGGLLLDSRRWDEVAETIDADDFYTRGHRQIFSAIRSLHDEDEAVDVVTTSEWLEKNGLLLQVGGLTYLGELANNTPDNICLSTRKEH